MKLRSHAILALFVGAVIIAGCAGRGGSAPVASQPVAANPPPAPVQQPPSSGFPQKDAPADRTDLTSQLVSRPAPRTQPQFQWPQPPNGTSYSALPSGILLVWTESTASGSSERPFSVSAVKAGGQVLWTYTSSASAREVPRVDVSPGGERLAFAEPGGYVRVLATVNGRVIATVRVQLDNPGTDSVFLIGDGQFLAVKRRTKSGVVPWVVDVYPVAAGAKTAYGNEGMGVAFSPYHDTVLGLQALDQHGVQIATSKGDAGLIPYEFQAQAEAVDLASSADGELIYVSKRATGLDVFGRDLKLRFHLDASVSLDTELAPVAKTIWHDTTPGTVQMIDAVGKTKTYTFDKAKITSGWVMPGGEKVFKVGTSTQKMDCVISGSGDVFGCFPFVGFASTTLNGRTFFWAQLQDGAIAAYKM